MIKIEMELNLGDFEAWSGGESNLNTIVEMGLVDEAMDYINEMTGGEPLTPGKLNDILWFSMDDFFEIYESMEG